MPKAIIDGREIEFEEGETILEAALRNGINIPHLCFNKRLRVKGRCRQCIVEVDGRIVASCTTRLREGMHIITDNEKIREYRKINLDLLKSRINTSQILEDEEILEYLEEEGLFEEKLLSLPIDNSSPAIVRNPNICILCGRCVAMCNEQSVGAINYAYRSINTVIIPAFMDEINNTVCSTCGQCTLVCPTGAIREKEDIDRVMEALNDKDKHVIIQTAPSIRASLGELFGLPPGTLVTGKMVTALKLLGFDMVFDTDLGADLTTFEEAHELWHRINNNGVLPMTTSCCPAWIKFMEHFYPDLAPHVSTCKSPHEMFGAIAKSYYAKLRGIDPSRIVVVSAMPCTAKKFEAQRQELTNDGYRNVDYVLTTREIARMIKEKGIDFNSLEESEFDKPLGISSGAGAIYGATGGVTESVLRTLAWIAGEELGKIEYREVRGMEGVRETEINIKDKKIKICIVHGLGNARKIMEKVRNKQVEYHFIEVMACPGGCIGGGGQPKSNDINILRKRAMALYTQDKKLKIRKAHENPIVRRIYDEFLEKPLSEKAHKYLHTSYIDRTPKV